MVIDDMDKNVIWLDKKVFVSIKNSNRKYSGKVISEDEFSIVINDINDKLVYIRKDSTDFIQEERE